MPSETRVVHGLAARLEPRRLITGALTVIVVAMAGWWLVRPPSTPIDATLAVATTANGSRSGPSASGAGASAGGTAVSGGRPDDADTIVVHAAGAVVAPGVYKMASGARVSDLITAAGGPTADGDPNALNLAGELRDGDRIAVPVVGQAPAGGSYSAGASGPAGASGLSVGAPRVVDLNRGTAQELDALPGIGPATAAAIIAFRDQHGPFGSVDDLLDVPGIGPAKLEAIREFVDV